MTTDLVATEALRAPESSAPEVWRPSLRKGVELQRDAVGGGFATARDAGGEVNTFAFGVHEFRLAVALDGTRTLEDVRHYLATSDPALGDLRTEQVERLVNWIGEMDLLVPRFVEEGSSPLPVEPSVPPIPSEGDLPTDGMIRMVAATSSPEPRPLPRLLTRLMLGVTQAACIATLVWGAQFFASSAWSDSVNGSAPAGVAGVIASEFDGVLVEFCVADGDVVAEGDVLALVDRADVAQQLERLQVELVESRRLRDHYYEEGQVMEYRQSVEAMASLTQTIGRLRFADQEVEILAPVSGVVRLSSEAPGPLGRQVSRGEPLITVVPGSEGSTDGEDHLLVSTTER